MKIWLMAQVVVSEDLVDVALCGVSGTHHISGHLSSLTSLRTFSLLYNRAIR